MTAPLGTALSQTAKLNFAGQGIKLPVNWRDMGSLYPRAFTPAEQLTQSNAPPNLFHVKRDLSEGGGLAIAPS